MSSGGIVLLLGAVVVAAAAAVVIVAVAAVAAAVLVVNAVYNAANAAANGALRAVGNFGAALEQRAADQSAAEAEAMRWQCAAADVVGLNARIRLLGQRAREHGVPADIPPPLDLAGQTADQAMAWAARTEPALRAAQAAIDAAATEHEWAAMLDRLPVAATGLDDVKGALRAYQDALARRYEAPAGAERAEPVFRGATVTSADVEAMLCLLDPDAAEAERADALTAAARVTAADQRDAAMYLRSLRRTIVEDINPRLERRRTAAEWLQALEQPAVAEAIAADPLSPHSDTARELRRVVAGERDLTPQLHASGRAALAWSVDVVQQRFLRDLVIYNLADLGYTVEGEFDVQQTTGLRLSRADWNGEHTADVWIDEQGTVQGRVVREVEAAGDEATLRDQARCEDFSEHLAETAQRIEAAGVQATVMTEPGRRPQRRHAPGTGASRTDATRAADSAPRHRDRR